MGGGIRQSVGWIILAAGSFCKARNLRSNCYINMNMPAPECIHFFSSSGFVLVQFVRDWLPQRKDYSERDRERERARKKLIFV